MGIRKKEMSTAFLGARGEGVLRVYIKIKDGTISGRVVGIYHGIKFSFTNRWPKNRGDLLAGEGDLKPGFHGMG